MIIYQIYMANGRVGMLQIFLYLVEGWIIYIILWWKLSENIIQNPNWWTKKFLSSNETTGRSKCHKRAFNAWAVTYRRAHRPNHWRGLQLTSLITRNVTMMHLNHLWKPQRHEYYLSLKHLNLSLEVHWLAPRRWPLWENTISDLVKEYR